jgi:hypothetical protein
VFDEVEKALFEIVAADVRASHLDAQRDAVRQNDFG